MYKLLGTRIIAVVSIAFTDFLYDHAALDTRICGNLTERLLDCTCDDMYTRKFVFIVTFKVFQSFGGTDITYSATRNNTFFDSRAGCIQCILHPVFLFLHFDFGSRAYIKHCDTAGEFAKTFLKFLPVIIGSGCGNLFTDKLSPFSYGVLVSASVHDSRIFLRDDDLFGTTEHVGSRVFKSKASFFRNDNGACKGCYILKHFLTTVSETRSFDSGDLQCATQPVYNQSSQSLAVYIFSDDEE